MINSRKELSFYIKADRMMNRGMLTLPWTVLNFFMPDYIMRLLVSIRKEDYYRNKGRYYLPIALFYSIRHNKLGLKTGISIPCDVFGYGLVIPHIGTIVVGNNNQIGNYCVLHTSTCITAGGKKIGDGLYLSTGAKIVHNVALGDWISVGANTLVNKSFGDNEIMVAGLPAEKKKDSEPWYIRDGEEFTRRHMECELLKKNMGL